MRIAIHCHKLVAPNDMNLLSVTLKIESLNKVLCPWDQDGKITFPFTAFEGAFISWFLLPVCLFFWILDLWVFGSCSWLNHNGQGFDFFFIFFLIQFHSLRNFFFCPAHSVFPSYPLLMSSVLLQQCSLLTTLTSPSLCCYRHHDVTDSDRISSILLSRYLCFSKLFCFPLAPLMTLDTSS